MRDNKKIIKRSYIPLGVAVGVAIGVSINNIPVGIAMGIAVAVSLKGLLLIIKKNNG